MAMQNLASMVKSVHQFSDPATDHYSRRVHVFGMLSGMLEPENYRTGEPHNHHDHPGFPHST